MRTLLANFPARISARLHAAGSSIYHVMKVDPAFFTVLKDEAMAFEPFAAILVADRQSGSLLWVLGSLYRWCLK